MELYIIAGPNGAGKTTFAHEFLPRYTDCRNFVNADLIARAIAPFSPDVAAFRAARMMLDEIDAFAKKCVPFAFETTLSGRVYLSFIRRCKAEGYEIHLFFLSLTSVDLAISRIRERVLRGGHGQRDNPFQVMSLDWPREFPASNRPESEPSIGGNHAREHVGRTAGSRSVDWICFQCRSVGTLRRFQSLDDESSHDSSSAIPAPNIETREGPNWHVVNRFENWLAIEPA